MNVVRRIFLLTMLLSATFCFAEETQPARSPIKELGDGKYAIEFIRVDKTNRRFTVPGLVAHLDEPLEYLAVTRDGYKEYESLLTLNTTATQFQLACILIGLDAEGSRKPRYQFDETEVEGQSVDIEITWDVDGKKRSAPANKVLIAGEDVLPEQDWVFIGSMVGEDGTFMAESIGSLIGFVHDPVAIIENRHGLGIGAYGGITGNSSLLPPVGALVTVSISVSNYKGGEGKTGDGE